RRGQSGGGEAGQRIRRGGGGGGRRGRRGGFGRPRRHVDRWCLPTRRARRRPCKIRPGLRRQPVPLHRRGRGGAGGSALPRGGRAGAGPAAGGRGGARGLPARVRAPPLRLPGLLLRRAPGGAGASGVRCAGPGGGPATGRANCSRRRAAAPAVPRGGRAVPPFLPRQRAARRAGEAGRAAGAARLRRAE
ncbi:hypothetical protein APUTEX25_000698, partial [Auxenochlorella protothecoides]